MTCSIAVSCGGRIINEINKELADPVKFLNLSIRECLSESGLKLTQIEAVSINTGPGAYTALRSGLATVKGICVGLNIPLIQINGMRLLVEVVKSSIANEVQTIIAVKSIRKDDYFVCLFQKDGTLMKEIQSTRIDDTFCLTHHIKSDNALIVGTDLNEIYFQIFDNQIFMKSITLLARHQIDLGFSSFNKGRFDSIQKSVPEYLMDPNITKAKQKLPNSLN
jgi:tRNA threonylcarbamoyladenosine biosynthesis protein TsaB